LVQFVLAPIIIVFVCWKIFDVLRENDFSKLILSDNAAVFLIITTILVFANWSLEAIKWKMLMQSLRKLTFTEALKGVLAGISTGIITPNRLGNFIGRVLPLEKKYKLKGTLLTLLANLSQFTITIFFGAIGLFFFFDFFREKNIILYQIVVILILFLSILAYFKPKLINRKPFSYLLNQRLKEGVKFIDETTAELKVKVLILSAIRYCIFLTQYILILISFHQDNSIMVLISSIASVYLLMTIVPSFFFGKLFVREASALVILGMVGIPDVVILFTGFLLWSLNIGLPSLIGTVILAQKK